MAGSEWIGKVAGFAWALLLHPLVLWVLPWVVDIATVYHNLDKLSHPATYQAKLVNYRKHVDDRKQEGRKC